MAENEKARYIKFNWSEKRLKRGYEEEDCLKRWDTTLMIRNMTR